MTDNIELNEDGLEAAAKEISFYLNEPSERAMIVAHAALLSYLAHVKPDSGWQSMETPPKILNDYLIWLKPIDGRMNSEWSVRKAFWTGGKWTEIAPDAQIRITHWQPLPQSPTTGDSR